MSDLLPNDGSTFYQFRRDEATEAELRQERATVVAGAPLLKQIIERLEARRDFYDSVDSIRVSVQSRPEEFQKAWEINRGTKANLDAEIEYLHSLLDEYIEKKQDTESE